MKDSTILAVVLGKLRGGGYDTKWIGDDLYVNWDDVERAFNEVIEDLKMEEYIIKRSK